MSFKPYVPKTRGGHGLPEGMMSLISSGSARFTRGDLNRAGIGRAVAVLIDEDLKRIALRSPREEKGLKEPELAVRLGKTGTSALVQLIGPIHALGLEPEQVRGRHEVMHKDGMLIVGPLTELAANSRKAKRRDHENAKERKAEKG